VPAVLNALLSAVSGKARRVSPTAAERAPIRRRAAIQVMRLLRWKRAGLHPLFLFLTLTGQEVFYTKKGERRTIWPELVESSAFGALPSLQREDLDAVLTQLVSNGAIVATERHSYQMAFYARPAEAEAAS
jgi:hypothetical protein